MPAQVGPGVAMTCGREETRFGVRRQRIRPTIALRLPVPQRSIEFRCVHTADAELPATLAIEKEDQGSTHIAEGIVISHHASRTGIFFPTEVALLRTTFDRICDQRKIGKGSPAADQLAHDLVVLFQGGLLDDFDLTEALRKARAKRFSSAANHVHQNDGLSDTSAT